MTNVHQILLNSNNGAEIKKRPCTLDIQSTELKLNVNDQTGQQFTIRLDDVNGCDVLKGA